MLLRLELESGDSETISTIGEIYVDPDVENALPEVTDVNVRPTRAARFHLDPGSYAYYFHIENGKGDFTLSVVRDDSNVVIAGPKKYSGTNHAVRRFVFQVG